MECLYRGEHHRVSLYLTEHQRSHQGVSSLPKPQLKRSAVGDEATFSGSAAHKANWHH